MAYVTDEEEIGEQTSEASLCPHNSVAQNEVGEEPWVVLDTARLAPQPRKQKCL